MTIAFADTVDRQENKDLIRWGASLLLVLVFHVAVAWLLLPREAPVEPSKPPPPAALLDLPPLPPAGAGGKPGSPPPPKPLVVQPAPPKPPVEEVKPPVPPAQEIKPPVPPVPPKPPVEEVKPPVPPAQEIKPPVPPVPPIPKFAVPLPVAPPKPQPLKPLPPRTAPTPPPQATGSAAPLLLDPMRVWQLAAVQRLEKFKKQSVAASWNGEQGVVGLNISIDRQGNILFASIASSSGYSSLDNQALSMCRLARRLPPLPPEFKREQYSFGVTIEFSLY
jgi:periplasmic protein TonB